MQVDQTLSVLIALGDTQAIRAVKERARLLPEIETLTYFRKGWGFLNLKEKADLQAF